MRLAVAGRIGAFAALALAPAAHAQSIPRTPDGRPDFQGVWESRWLTPFERPDGTDAATVSGEAATAFVAELRKKMNSGDGALHPDEDYDFTTLLPAPNGAFRTSLIVEPENGKRPQTQLAKDRGAAMKKRGDSMLDPEDRSNDERCIGAAGRAPLLVTPGSMYRQIVQTPANLVVYTEDQMSVRILGIDAAPRPSAIVSPAGDTIARWEGDTLVAVTTLLSPQLAPPGFPAYDQKRRVTERFTLTSPDAISYDYVLEDNVMLTGPVRVEYTLARTSHAMFESACHEGNYSLANMLRGARVIETKAAAANKSTKPKGK
jgi:hypothetical protein